MHLINLSALASLLPPRRIPSHSLANHGNRPALAQARRRDARRLSTKAYSRPVRRVVSRGRAGRHQRRTAGMPGCPGTIVGRPSRVRQPIAFHPSPLYFAAFRDLSNSQLRFQTRGGGAKPRAQSAMSKGESMSWLGIEPTDAASAPFAQPHSFPDGRTFRPVRFVSESPRSSRALSAIFKSRRATSGCFAATSVVSPTSASRLYSDCSIF